jgi:CheY-like chemotaxis protein
MTHILLVDDSKLQRLANMRILARAGYDVAVAGDGEEALALVAHECPDLILLDLLLPKMGGVDVLRALKQSARTALVPVIVVSGMSQKNEEKLLKEGAAAYFEKSCLSGRAYDDALVQITRKVLAESPVNH